MLAYYSAESETRKPVLQHAMYYRLYHRSRFSGRKTYARHMPRRVIPAGLRDKTVGRSQRGVSQRSTCRWVVSATRRVPPESGEPESLTGRSRGLWKRGVGDGYARASHPLTGRYYLGAERSQRDARLKKV